MQFPEQSTEGGNTAVASAKRFSPLTQERKIQHDSAAGVANIPADLLPLLRCPITGSALRWMDESELGRLNADASRGDAAHLDGTPVDETIPAALVNMDGSLAYRIGDGILMMLPITAIALTRAAAAQYGGAHRREKADIKGFYDRIGWTRSESGHFEDAVVFEDLRPVSAAYIRKAHLRLKNYLLPSGDYLLDVASGPVQYPEYLTYSQDYKRRVCMDISISALREARRKLGDKGVYILGDITKLPLQSNALDAVISLHTIYHVPKDEQRNAFEELYRVLKPGRRGLIVYTFTDSLLMRLGAWPSRGYNAARHSAPARGLKRLLGKKPAAAAPAAAETAAKESQGVGFYFYAHSLKWFTSQTWSFPLRIVTWRSMDVQFMRKYIHPRRFGKLLLALIYGFETLFPRFTGRHGAYPMFLLEKSEP